MDAVVALTPRYLEQTPTQAAAALKQLIYDDRVIRSLSLVDARLRVVASSTMRNNGVALPDDFLPETKTRPGSAVIDFGRVFPYRDLYEVGQAPIAGAENAFWMVSSPVRVGDAVYHWVATALGVGLFLQFVGSLQQRSCHGDHPLRLFRASHRKQREQPKVDSAALSAALWNRSNSGCGARLIRQSNRLMVSYRGSGDHSVIMAVTGDTILAQRAADSLDKYYWAAGALSLLLVLITAVLYRWYLRYELSISELSNQAKAMSAHLIISESDPGAESSVSTKRSWLYRGTRGKN